MTKLVVTMTCQGTTSGGSLMYEIHRTGQIVALLGQPKFRVHILDGLWVVKPKVFKVAVAPLKQHLKIIYEF